MGSALAPCAVHTWLLPQPSFCGCAIFAMSRSTSASQCFHFHTGILRNPWTQLLLNLEFYGAPILLEDVPEEKFLGTICSVVPGAITTLQLVDTTVLLKSVGNREHVLSGFSSKDSDDH